MKQITTPPPGSYTHLPSPMKAYIPSILAIAASAIPGTLMAWWLIAPFGWPKLVMALTVPFLAMAFSVGIFAGIVTVLKKLGRSL
jgi:hypothetical protein